MEKIEINKCVYSVHPIYDLYAADQNGNIIHLIKKVPNKGSVKDNDYSMTSVRKHGCRQKRVYVHRFVWECFNGDIPEGQVVDHINDDKQDNRLCNLQLMTQQQNCKKSAKNRDYKFAAKNHENRKCIKAANLTTKEDIYFFSMFAVQQHLGINAGIVKMVCEGLNNCKSGKSKKDGQFYTFEYIEQKNLPSGYLKSANKRPRRRTDEEKKQKQRECDKNWRQKEYHCPVCNKTLKNGSKYLHNKKCFD